jgi:hypothetical protein
MMEARKQVCDLLKAVNAVTPFLADGTPLSETERTLVEAVISRLRSMLWKCIQRESCFLQMPSSKQRSPNSSRLTHRP